MEQTRKKTIWIVLAALIVLAACTIFTLLLLTGKVTSPQESSSEEESSGWLIYIDRDDSADSVRAKSALGWRWDIYNKVLAYHHHTGRYRVEAGSTCLHLYRQLRNGIQEPIKLVIPTSRTMERLAAMGPAPPTLRRHAPVCPQQADTERLCQPDSEDERRGDSQPQHHPHPPSQLHAPASAGDHARPLRQGRRHQRAHAPRQARLSQQSAWSELSEFSEYSE